MKPWIGHFCEDSGVDVGYARGRRDTPATPLRRGYSDRFRAIYNLTGLELYLKSTDAVELGNSGQLEVRASPCPLVNSCLPSPDLFPTKRIRHGELTPLCRTFELDLGWRKFRQHLPYVRGPSSYAEEPNVTILSTHHRKK
jgi:hypothetical protein